MRQLSSTSWGFYLPLDQHGRIIDGSSRRNPPERCPSPLYSQDCPEENPNVPENHQREDLTDIKVEDEEEERVRGAQPCKSEVEEEIPGGVTRVVTPTSWSLPPKPSEIPMKTPPVMSRREIRIRL
ncbi:uncharacterized protein LOC142708480 [Rhinoderma darwinii]|uniref:uncharacterized protein LOC142708480 n=1 Tax=Rhinoderma darwinii TaxID=43563 RepID=UPI003F660E06